MNQHLICQKMRMNLRLKVKAMRMRMREVMKKIVPKTTISMKTTMTEMAFTMTHKYKIWMRQITAI